VSTSAAFRAWSSAVACGKNASSTSFVSSLLVMEGITTVEWALGLCYRLQPVQGSSERAGGSAAKTKDLSGGDRKRQNNSMLSLP